jgi:D-alanyl-D-alanine carboxypeptidase
VGETLTIEQLLYLTMVHSACDATEVLAEYVGGTTENFVQMMNDYAASLGCTNTHFVNPDGLHDENHYTTASDIGKNHAGCNSESHFRQDSETVQYEYNGCNFITQI